MNSNQAGVRQVMNWMCLSPVARATLVAVVFCALQANAQPTQAVLPPNVDSVFTAFPDFGYMISPSDFSTDYPGQKVFRLKTDYPDQLPGDAALPAVMGIDFATDSRAYLESIRHYCFDGNTPSWDPYDNEVRPWYHIPWLHPNSDTGYPPNGGTEGFHGLIKEAPVGPFQLSADQVGNYQVYAITLINEYAGYTVGKMWADPLHPDPRAADDRFAGMGFPEGTVFCKLLFTDATNTEAEQIPFLSNPLTWTAYITQSWDDPTRAPKEVHLLQMDIMVKDSRSVVGWVFGTFAYNGELGNENRFDNLVPLGVQWGQDPQDTVNRTNRFPFEQTQVNNKLQETVITDSRNLPPQHLGWNSRLNGPADLNTSSCLSCHLTGTYPAIVSLVADGMVPDGGTYPPAGGSTEWMRWFQNYTTTEPMVPEAYQTGLSLQVAISLQNFEDFMNPLLKGLWATEFTAATVPISRAGAKE